MIRLAKFLESNSENAMARSEELMNLFAYFLAVMVGEYAPG